MITKPVSNRLEFHTLSSTLVLHFINGSSLEASCPFPGCNFHLISCILHFLAGEYLSFLWTSSEVHLILWLIRGNVGSCSPWASVPLKRLWFAAHRSTFHLPSDLSLQFSKVFVLLPGEVARVDPREIILLVKEPLQRKWTPRVTASECNLQVNEGSRIRATTFTRLMDYNNGLIISSFFLSLLSFLLDRCSIPSREVSILWSYLDYYIIIFFLCVSYFHSLILFFLILWRFLLWFGETFF